MPMVPFETLPAHARVWIFASDRPLAGGESDTLLQEVDRFLDGWMAHGVPLRCGREWRDNRFLAIGVDPTVEQASGCSIDGMYRVLGRLESKLGTGLLRGGRVFFRRPGGDIAVAQHNQVGELARAGELDATTPVFDLTVASLTAYRESFEQPARRTWVGSLLESGQASHESRREATNASSARKG